MYDSRSTLFVPVDRVDLSEKMRRVLSPEEIEQLVQAIPDETPEWIEDDTERAQQYRSILSSGDRAKLVRMIKALYLRKEALAEKGRKLRTADEHFLKRRKKSCMTSLHWCCTSSRSRCCPSSCSALN